MLLVLLAYELPTNTDMPTYLNFQAERMCLVYHLEAIPIRYGDRIPEAIDVFRPPVEGTQ